MPSFSTQLWLLLLLGLLWGCSSSKTIVKEPGSRPEPTPQEPVTEPEYPEPKPVAPVSVEKFTNVPETPREFRGVWVATVANIDWPSKPGLPVAKQKKELIAIMDKAASLNLNAIILQVRPAADALYLSPYEPWSEYLTGTQGEPPEPFYDPLAFAVQAAHQRGLQLHAWFNPFRARHPSADGALAPGHIGQVHPEMVLRYGNYLWLDPGLAAARRYSIDVIADVVRRYDIDGVHLDDYFYPYPVRNSRGRPVPFPDTLSYGQEIKMESAPPINDWRRQNVDTFVQQLNKEIKLIDPHVRFSISHFGIWTPGYPKQIRGFDAYNRLFADARKWLWKGWVDYLAPQLYWTINKEGQSFPVLLKWWYEQYTHERHLWPGLYTSKLGMNKGGWPKYEIEQQQQIVRQHPGVSESIHFSMKAFLADSSLQFPDLYAEKALIQATPWLDNNENPPTKPKIRLQKSEVNTRLWLPKSSNIRWWVVKAKYGAHWEIDIYPGCKQQVALADHHNADELIGVVVTAVDELGRESAGRQFRVK